LFIHLCLIVGGIISFAIVYAIPEMLPWGILIFCASALATCAAGVLFLFVCSLFFYGKRPLEKDNSFCRFLSYVTMDAILTLFRFRVRGEGLEKLPEEPFVLVCNHLSRFDPMVSFVLMKHRQLGFISKKENMKIPIVGPITSRIGFFPLDRENPLRAMRTLHAAAKLIREKGFCIGIYPEGTRSRNGELLPFKPGAFVMAKKAHAPIVVSSISGTNAYRNRFPFRTTPAVFRVIEVIPASQVEKATVEDLAQRCYQTISENR